MSKANTSVEILGSTYKIACPPEEADAVKKAAVYLNNKLSEVKESSGLDEKRAAIITALNITNEYLKNLSDVSKDESINKSCLLYTSPSPRDREKSRMPSSA